MLEINAATALEDVGSVKILFLFLNFAFQGAPDLDQVYIVFIS